MAALPTGTEIWPGILIAYIATVFLELGLLPWQFGKMQLNLPLRQVLKISAHMNLASYSLLALTLICLIYLPALKYEDKSLLNQMSGRLSVLNYAYSQTVDMRTRPFILSAGKEFGDGVSTAQMMLDGSVIVTFNEASAKRLTWKNGWLIERIQLHKRDSRLIAISPDAKLMLVYIKEKTVLMTSSGIVKRVISDKTDNYAHGCFSSDNRFLAYSNPSQILDLKTGKITKLDDFSAPTFHPTKSILAWSNSNSIILYDCLSGKKKTTPVPGNIVSQVSWSYDGKFIAYLGHPNAFTAQMWTPDLRVVDIKTGRSVTVYPKISTGGRPFSTIIWCR